MGAGRVAAAVLVFVLAVAGASRAQERPAEGDTSATQPILNDDQLLRKYVWSTLGPGGAIGAGIVAGFEQWQRYPSEWGEGASGYAKRWTSAYAAGAIGNTTKYAVARLMHQDPSFTKCDCTGFNARMRHATAAPFMARTRDGRYVFSFATIAGATAEHVIPAAAWYPPGRVWSDGVGLAAVGIASKIGVDIMREFVPLPKFAKRNKH